MRFKINIILLLACFAGLFALLSLCSWKKSTNLNTNGWSICIGKNEILTSWKQQHRGDTAFLNRKNINFNDSLFVSEFICGGIIKPPQIILHISKDNNPVVQIELSRIGAVSFFPLIKLHEHPDFEKLKVEVHSSFNHYYPGFDKNKPMATLIAI